MTSSLPDATPLPPLRPDGYWTRPRGIEAAAKRAYIEYQEDGPAFSIAREDAELWTVLAENIIDAYERALAEQPREELVERPLAERRVGAIWLCDCGIWGTGPGRCGRCGSESLQPGVALLAEQPREERTQDLERVPSDDAGVPSDACKQGAPRLNGPSGSPTHRPTKGDHDG